MKLCATGRKIREQDKGRTPPGRVAKLISFSTGRQLSVRAPKASVLHHFTPSAPGRNELVEKLLFLRQVQLLLGKHSEFKGCTLKGQLVYRQLQIPLFALDSQMNWNKNELKSRAPHLGLSRAEVTPTLLGPGAMAGLAGTTADAPSSKYSEISKYLFTELVDKHAPGTFRVLCRKGTF